MDKSNSASNKKGSNKHNKKNKKSTKTQNQSVQPNNRKTEDEKKNIKETDVPILNNLQTEQQKSQKKDNIEIKTAENKNATKNSPVTLDNLTVQSCNSSCDKNGSNKKEKPNLVYQKNEETSNIKQTKSSCVNNIDKKPKQSQNKQNKSKNKIVSPGDENSNLKDHKYSTLQNSDRLCDNDNYKQEVSTVESSECHRSVTESKQCSVSDTTCSKKVPTNDCDQSEINNICNDKASNKIQSSESNKLVVGKKEASNHTVCTEKLASQITNRIEDPLCSANIKNNNQEVTKGVSSSDSKPAKSFEDSYKKKQDLLLAALQKPAKELADPENQTQSVNMEKKDAIKKDGLTEKELRKLEWQKKFAEQNSKPKATKETGGLSKAELKARRREQQEAQRLAKLEVRKVATPVLKSSEMKDIPKSKMDTVTEKAPVAASKTTLSKQIFRTQSKPVIKPAIKKSYLNDLVSHLPNSGIDKLLDSNLIVNPDVHPSFVKLGVQMSSKVIIGSNARCAAFLSAVINLVRDLQVPQKQEFCRYLESVLQTSVDYLNSCRPLSVCMKNALKYFKSYLTQMNINMTDKEKKNELVEVLENYVRTEIEMADKGIVIKVMQRIKEEDVILTYGCSSLIEKILITAHKEKKFEVIIVDSRPLLEGRELVRRLTLAGVPCKYVLMNALSHMMNLASVVLVGAHAMLFNGHIMARVGTAQVALMAKTFNKPFIVCSEAYKLSDVLQCDAFLCNEIGPPQDLLHTDRKDITTLKSSNKLSAMNLLYDVTPPCFITVIITELSSFHGKGIPSIRQMKPDKLL